MVGIKKPHGFTLIELVIVIAILGILAATALPKFANLTDQARLAAAQGVAGALGSAVNIAHAKWLADAEPASISLEGGQNVVLSSTGWPEATSGTADGTMTDAKCAALWNGILQNPPSGSATTCTGSCEYEITGTGSTCSFEDQQGASGNIITYNISTGVVTSP